MKNKKIISILLTVLLMFSFCSFSVFATFDGSGELSIDQCTVIAQVIDGDGTTNVTSDMVITNPTAGIFKGLRGYGFPEYIQDDKIGGLKLRVIEDFSVRAGHEYNIKFKYGYNLGMPFALTIYLNFKNASGSVVKAQTITTVQNPGHQKVNSIDLNFTPSVPEDASGYKCDLYIELTQNENNPSSGLQTFYISQTISLTDLDDNSAELNGILGAILSIPEKIKGFFSSLADSISGFFQQLSDNIKGFFDSLKNYILYFQDPVTLNSEGVLVGANGEPIYVNPFENSIDSIEETFNGWIEDIRSFVSGMDESRVQVSQYLQTGTGLINDVLSASPIISAVLIFIASFFVIRKVVGR